MDLLHLIDPLTAIFWFVLGSGLIVLEILMPAFLALGFGFGAWIMALALFFTSPSWLTAAFAFMAWAVISAGVWVVLRLIFRNSHSDKGPYDGDINEY